jgi:hypothetical protein
VSFLLKKIHCCKEVSFSLFFSVSVCRICENTVSWKNVIYTELNKEVQKKVAVVSSKHVASSDATQANLQMCIGGDDQV